MGERLLGYAVRAGEPATDALPATEDEAVAVMADDNGKRRFMDEQALSERLDDAQTNNDRDQAKAYLKVLEGLHEAKAKGTDLGKPLESVNDFIASPESPEPESLQITAVPINNPGLARAPG